MRDFYAIHAQFYVNGNIAYKLFVYLTPHMCHFLLVHTHAKGP